MTSKGFTLIELMIVAAIVAIIAAIAIPALSGKGLMAPSSNGTVVQSVDVNTPRCVNGILLKNNEPVVKDGVAVRC